jgi:hypothetical protein
LILLPGSVAGADFSVVPLLPTRNFVKLPLPSKPCPIPESPTSEYQNSL